jgi:endothelin-converting enzyme
MSLHRASALCPELDLQGLVKVLLKKADNQHIDIDKVIVTSPAYLSALSNILGTTSRIDLNLLFVWQIVRALTDYVESDKLLPYKRLRNGLLGQV